MGCGIISVVDLHRLAEERSIAYHRLVAEKIARDPSVLERARRRVGEWRSTGSVHSHYVDAWEGVLSLPFDALSGALVDPSERMAALRQVTPFAGAIDARTRWRVWREVRQRSAP